MHIYLNSYGTYLHVKDEMFEIRIPESGEQVAQTKYFAAHKLKGIVISVSAALSTDAVALALKHNIDIIFSDRSGHPLGRVWHSKLGSTTLIRKRQLEASLGTDAVYWTLEWLSQKLQNQVDFIKWLKKHRSQHQHYLDDKIARIESLQLAMAAFAPTAQIDQIAEQIRGIEGTAGRLYFETISYVLPPQYQFEGRSFRPAQDAFNAFLNYAYGVLYSKTEKVLMVAGLDPYVGFLHRDDYNHKSLVYDFIEPYRSYCDMVVFKLFSAKKIKNSFLDELRNGVSLNKEGKVCLLTDLTQFLDEDRIRYRGRNQTRANIMQLEAHQFAQALLQKTKEEI